ncbi:hypothetical protein PL671_11955 [Phocaeicola vulgatus]|nr:MULTISPECIES: hypothetical protein [Bacteroidaceae]MCS2959936.1 hypothetical protein [Bacteroides thetaiotaomicron]MBV3782777.1 hypothetical protein [Phocaeicola vulgatus]MDB0777404.1 hypothetical protein [Phocaeicola vulgatus]MDB0785822.1 hypothetical protein [Phocaeicola vulgatus]MDB0817282.1 hypothetical protein [Phocaeicola vulgatus]
MFELLLEARELYLQDVILNGKRYDRYVDDFINCLVTIYACFDLQH